MQLLTRRTCDSSMFKSSRNDCLILRAARRSRGAEPWVAVREIIVFLRLTQSAPQLREAGEHGEAGDCSLTLR
jgi:hypothetical protein